MRSIKPLLVTATLLPIALLASCAATVIPPSASPCSALLPDEWKHGVAPVNQPESLALPTGEDDATPWQKGFVGQTGQLEISNDHYQAALGKPGGDGGIIGRCEKRDAAAVKAARPKVLGIF